MSTRVYLSKNDCQITQEKDTPVCIRIQRSRATVKDLVVSLSPADNSLSANTRYNALISPPSEGALPWCRIFFSTSWC